MRMKKSFKFIISVLVTCVFAYLAFGRMDWGKALDALRTANVGLIVLGLGFLAADYFIKIIRWWIILRKMGVNASLMCCSRPFLVSFAFNNIFPLRAGDMARVFGFRETIGGNAPTVLGSVFVERILDFFSLLIFFYIGLSALPSGTLPVYFVHTAGLIAVALLAALLFLVFMPGTVLSIINFIFGSSPLSRFSLAKKIRDAGADFIKSLKMIRDPFSTVGLLALSCLIWLLEGGLFASVAWSLGIGVEIQAALFSMSTGTLATLLPSTPGYIGTFDYFAILGLMAFGANRDLVGIYALLCHILLWLPVTAAGLACGLGHECRNIIALKKEKNERI